MWRSLIFWRLFGFYGVVLLTSIGLLGVVIVGRVNRHNLEQVEESLRVKAILVRELVRDRPSDQTAQLQQRIQSLRNEVATRITLVAEDGTVIADSDEDPAQMDNHANRPEINGAREAGYGSTTRFSGTVNQPMMYVAVRADEGIRPIAFVRIAWPLDKVEAQSAWLSQVVGTTAAITAIVALTLAWWVASRFTKPLQELTAGARRIASGNYDQKLYIADGGEFGTLARSFNDMSQQLKSQFAQLASDRQQLRMILSGMVEGVVALDSEERILFANERAAELLEIDSQEATGRKLWELVRQRSLQDLVQRALAEREHCREEVNWNGPNAKNLTVYAARLGSSPQPGAVLVMYDTTDLRRLERLRRDFVANVSHELKTPLSVITACVETLLDGAIDEPEHRVTFLERISEQSERLHALILDLLSLARIESGTEIFEFSRVPVEPLIRASIVRHLARAESKQQLLEVGSANSENGDSDLVAWGDPEAIEQILDNLIDNAVKYTPVGGRIRIRCGHSDQGVCIEVEDNGIGIPEGDLPRVFERFFRVDKARSRELGGTGLGLSIVKHLVQAMRGRIRATSRVGQGTTFSVELPLPAAETSTRLHEI